MEVLTIDEIKNIKEIWSKSGFIKLKCTNGKYYTMNFKISHIFELGKMYIGNNLILYLIDKKHEKMALNAISKINSIKYDNFDMEIEFNKYLPKIKECFKTISGEMGIVVQKDEDLILLKDLITCCNGKISLSEISYIISSLYNIACFINYNGLSHNGITPYSCFVSIKNKYVSLLGGWWYASKLGKPILGMPKEIRNIVSYKFNKSNSIIDLESIRSMGKKLLGDSNGIILSRCRGASKNLIVWLEENSSSNQFDEYTKWTIISKKMKDENFIRLDLNKKTFYNEV